MPRRANNSTRKVAEVSASLRAAGKAVATAAAKVAEMKGYIKERAEMTKAAQANGGKNRSNRNRSRKNRSRRNRN
jgi:hypothetical protein